MIFFKCLASANCGRKMTYLTDGKGCNMCGAPCEILNDSKMPANRPDHHAVTSLGPLHNEILKSHVGMEDSGCDMAIQQMSRVTLETSMELANTVTSIADSSSNIPEDLSGSWDIFSMKKSPPSSSYSLPLEPLEWKPDGVFGFGSAGKLKEISPELNPFTSPPGTHNNISQAFTINEANDILSANRKTQKATGALSATVKTNEISYEAPHLELVGGPITTPKSDTDQESEAPGPCPKPGPSSSKTSPRSQSPNLSYTTFAKTLGNDEIRRKRKDKKKARKARKRAEAETAVKEHKRSEALKARVNTSPPQVAVLEKPDPVSHKTPTRATWNAVARKGYFTKETTIKGRKEVNSSSYLAREMNEKEENTPPKFVEVRFNIGKMKHDSKRIVPRHVVE